MVMLKKNISALVMQCHLGHKRYEPIWFTMHKIRLVMGITDNKFELEGVAELDNAFFNPF